MNETKKQANKETKSGRDVGKKRTDGWMVGRNSQMNIRTDGRTNKRRKERKNEGRNEQPLTKEGTKERNEGMNKRRTVGRTNDCGQILFKKY